MRYGALAATSEGKALARSLFNQKAQPPQETEVELLRQIRDALAQRRTVCSSRRLSD